MGHKKKRKNPFNDSAVFISLDQKLFSRANPFLPPPSLLDNREALVAAAERNAENYLNACRNGGDVKLPELLRFKERGGESVSEYWEYFLNHLQTLKLMELV
ncbi:hypothetical protein PY479_05210 [Shewanella sp. A32]|uniref:hypothetical protein n=1 Tax=Shewanella sp. A32 TaxID=3031327 RepID=UPI0023BA09B0|nr:hypothetical protein [Shewanella sp. A32]MDF0533678.1 hypothetical protein [Shewanella sp. A32]